MLIQKLMIGSSVFIGNKVKVTVLDIDGKVAEIGIEAPGTLEILREKDFYASGSKLTKSSRIENDAEVETKLDHKNIDT